MHISQFLFLKVILLSSLNAVGGAYPSFCKSGKILRANFYSNDNSTTIPCIYDKGEANVTLYKGNKITETLTPISPNNDGNIQTGNYIRNVGFSVNLLKNEGIPAHGSSYYTCLFDNSDNTSFVVTQLFRDDYFVDVREHIGEHPTCDLEYFEGSNVTFYCKVLEKHYKTNFTWSLPSNQKCKVSVSKHHQSNLGNGFIQDEIRMHFPCEGKYLLTCHVQAKKINEGQYASISVVIRAPHVTHENSEPKRLTESSIFNLTCTFKGESIRPVRWERNGDVLNAVTNFTQTGSNIYYTLKDVSPTQDETNYTCVVSLNEKRFESRTFLVRKPGTNLQVKKCLNLTWEIHTRNDHVLFYALMSFVIGTLTTFLLVLVVYTVWRKHKDVEYITREHPGHLPPIKIHYESYDDIQPLGSGKYGDVYKAKYSIRQNGRLQDRRDCVLKVFQWLPEMSSAQAKTVYKNFREEIRILQRLHTNDDGHDGGHANIVGYLGVDAPYVRYFRVYLVMKYCSHGDMERFLPNNKDVLTTWHLVRWAEQISAAMEFIHSFMVFIAQKNIVHRDLAARNILLHSNTNSFDDLVVKVADFGLAKVVSSSDQQYSSKVTFWYPPESIGENAIFTKESDVWSYGVLLWEMFTFATMIPYCSNAQQPTIQQLKEKVLFTRLSREDALLPIPEDVWRLMEECWKIKASERPKFSRIRNVLEMFNRAQSSLAGSLRGPEPNIHNMGSSDEKESFL